MGTTLNSALLRSSTARGSSDTSHSVSPRQTQLLPLSHACCRATIHTPYGGVFVRFAPFLGVDSIRNADTERPSRDLQSSKAFAADDFFSAARSNSAASSALNGGPQANQACGPSIFTV